MSGHHSPQDAIRLLALQLLVMVISLTVHEFAHAWAARRLGDDTAEREGRLSLSPVSHIDPVGSLLIPAMGALFGGISFLGWARPTPFNPARFRRDVPMRTGIALVSAAGPASNLVLALLAAGALAAVLRFRPELMGSGDQPSGVGALLYALFHVNVGLTTLNLLPIPPLDGSRMLPRSFDGLVARIAPFSFIVLLLVLNVPALRGILLDAPFALLERGIRTIFQLGA